MAGFDPPLPGWVCPPADTFFGGWTKRILHDNMRQVVVGAQRTNARFLDFCRHYGFEAKRHRPYRPRTKGKVERTVGYVRTSFLNGRTFSGLDDLNVRIHAHHRRAPLRPSARSDPHPA